MTYKVRFFVNSGIKPQVRFPVHVLGSLKEKGKSCFTLRDLIFTTDIRLPTLLLCIGFLFYYLVFLSFSFWVWSALPFVTFNYDREVLSSSILLLLNTVLINSDYILMTDSWCSEFNYLFTPREKGVLPWGERSF